VRELTVHCTRARKDAGSFDTLAPLLSQRLQLTIVCIDPPGCGFSDHRPRSSNYADFEEVPLIGEVADCVGVRCVFFFFTNV